MLATLIATALSCRYRSLRKKRMSLGPAVLVAVVAPFFTLLVLNLFQDGSRVFSMAYWSADAGLAVLPVLWAFAAAICFLPSLGVYAFYRSRQRI